ncbi:MAG: YceI family protein [Ilumatobacteraceae bacterium]|jgi:polyisoprenoid-binding protein YceI|nr:YceI family protein [Ilumatobacteraceae bacterium]
MARRSRVVLATSAAVIALVVGGPWVYINLIKDDAPDELSLESTTDTPSATAPTSTSGSTSTDDVSGTWTISNDSVVGYRVKEVLFGQDTEGVGRTSQVTGSLTISDESVSAAEFTVDMASIESDSGKRDSQFRGRIMDTTTYPTATFTLTSPITFPDTALTGTAFTIDATGDLSLRGTTKAVTFPLEAQLTDGTVRVAGKINIDFADWSIPNPGFGGITTEDNGDLEFLLTFSR